MSLPIVSHSEIDTFLLCERRHYYAFGEKLQRKHLSRSLGRGILGHEILAGFFTRRQQGMSYDDAVMMVTVDLSNKMIEATDENTRVIVTELMNIIPGFLVYFQDDIEPWRILAVEKEFRLDFPDFQFAFRPDLIATRYGFPTLFDYKFTYDFYSTDMTEILPQLPRYTGALRALGHTIPKASYIFIRYRKNTIGPKAYQMSPITLGNKRVTGSFEEVIKNATKIKELKALPLPEWRAETSRVANNLVCKSCSFKDLCAIETSGESSTLHRVENYEKSTYGYKEIADA